MAWIRPLTLRFDSRTSLLMIFSTSNSFSPSISSGSGRIWLRAKDSEVLYGLSSET